MSGISLAKYDPTHDLDDSPDREEFVSCVLLPMYLSAFYSQDVAAHIYRGLTYNNLLAFRRLLGAGCSLSSTPPARRS